MSRKTSTEEPTVEIPDCLVGAHVPDSEVILTRSQPSVLIKSDSKNVLSFEVKAYADTMDEALAEAIKAMDVLDKVKQIARPSEP